MATRKEMESELQQAYSQLEAADAAGAYDDAYKLQTYARSLENDLGLYPDAKDPYANVQIEDEIPPEEDGGPALQARDIQQAERSIDSDAASRPTASDYDKTLMSSMSRFGADFLRGFERRHRQTQYEKLEQMRALKDGQGIADPGLDAEYQKEIDKLEVEVERGKQVDPTFYGTFIKGFAGDKLEGWSQGLSAYAEELDKSRTEVAQVQAAKPFVPEGFDPLDSSTWDLEGSALGDIDSFMLKVASNAPQLAVSIGSARLGGKGGAMFKGRQLRRAGITNPEVVRQQAAKFGAATGTLTGSGTEYVMVRDNVASGTEESIRKQWENQELWDENDRYNDLIDKGFSSETAKQVMTTEIANGAGNTAGVVSAILGAPMSRFFAKLGLEQAASRVGAGAKGFAGETLQEGVQELSEQLTQNIYESGIDPNKPLTAGLLEAFVGGAAIGGPVGGAGGVLSGGDATQTAFNKDQREVAKAGFTEWRNTANERLKLGLKIGDPEYIKTTDAEVRVADFRKMEDLRLKEAQAYLRSEKKIRSMQEKYGAEAAERKRTDIFSLRYKATVDQIERSRKSRRSADEVAITEAQMAAERDEMLAQVEADATQLVDLEAIQTSLDAVAAGEALDEAAYEPLIEQKYGRWTSKNKTKFVLTPAGRAAQASIGSAIDTVKGKLDSGYAGDERRSNASRRAELAAMSEEERLSELQTDPLTKMKNRRAFDDAEIDEGPAPAYAYVDMDSLAWVNDNMGHTAGDSLLRKVAQAFKTAGMSEDAYRVGGDEIVVRGASEEELEDTMQKVAKSLDEYQPVTDVSGRSVQPVVTWGTGTTSEEADAAMLTMKRQRTTEKKRAETKQEPTSLLKPGQIRQRQKQLPLLSYDPPGPTDLSNIADEIALTANATDEFTRYRHERMVQRLRVLTRDSEEELADLALKLRQSIEARQLSNAELKLVWDIMPQEAQDQYEVKASEFYSRLAGEYISGLEAYQIENGSQTLSEKLPDAKGNYEESAEFAALDRLIKDGSLPPEVVRWASNKATDMNQKGMSIASPTHALALRVADYLGGEMYLGGPNPFSSQVDEYDGIHNRYSSDLLPILHLGTDPIMDRGFYKDVRKGDPVEVIIKGQSVIADVVASDVASITVRWDSNGPQLFNPDTREQTNTARFSKDFGWQVSGRASQGGNPFSSQSGSWPGQARLGRRLNGITNRWETASEGFRRRQAREQSLNNTLRNVPKILRNAARTRATKKQMNQARRIGSSLFAGYRNMPAISLASSIADLPQHMQELLAAHVQGPNAGSGVRGMFDEVNPANGVWILVGNNAQWANNNSVSLAKAITETMIHETVGHYGMRGVLGSEQIRDSYMDALEKSFSKEVLSKGISYGFTWYDPASKKALYLSEEHRRLAAEEWFAEMVQEMDINKLAPPQKNIVQRILNAIRTWMADHGLGRYAVGPLKWSDTDLMQMVANAQRFVQTGRGFDYQMKDGRNLTAMRDTDMFYASILNEFQNAMRPTTSQERDQMKKKGLAPEREVKLFPSEATKGAFLQGFKKLVKDNKVKQTEYVLTGVEGWLEGLTPADILRFSNSDELPLRVQEEYKRLDAIYNFDEGAYFDKVNARDHEWRELTKIADSVNDPLVNQRIADLKAWLAVDGRPSDEERGDASFALSELLNAPIGKKVKISMWAINDFLIAGSPRVRIKPSDRYRWDSDQEGNNADINPNDWPAQRPINPDFAEYVPVGVNREKYGVNIFIAENPIISTSVSSQGHSFHAPGGDSSSFMHVRYSEGVLSDDALAYEIVEVQSDVFGKAANSMASHNENVDRSARVAKAQSVLSSAATSLFSLTSDEIVNKLLESSQDLTPQGNIDRTAILAEAYQDLDVVISASQDLFNETSEVLATDVRAPAHLDALALYVSFTRFRDQLARAKTEHEKYPEDFMEKPEEYRKDWARGGKFNAGDSGGGGDLAPVSRVMADQKLLGQFLNGTIGAIRGREYSSEEVSEIQKGLVGNAVEVVVTIPEELTNDLTEQLGEEYFENFLGRSLGSISALGFNGTSLRKNEAGEWQLSMTGSSTVDVPPHVAIHSMIASDVKHWIAANWEKKEDRRIGEVNSDIKRIEGKGVNAVVDQDAALEEINYGETANDSDINVFEENDWAEISESEYLYQWKQIYLRNIRAGDTWQDQFEIGDLEDSDGMTIDRDHPEYRDRITVDDDGDADTSDAESWLEDAMTQAFQDAAEPGGTLDQSAEERAELAWEELSDTDKYTVEKYFAVPVAWDEEDNVIETRDGYMIGPLLDESSDSEDAIILGTYYWGWLDDAGDYIDYWFDTDRTEQGITATVMHYYKNQGIVPPSDSAFFIARNPDVPQSLIDQRERRPAPSISPDVFTNNQATSESILPYDSVPEAREEVIVNRQKLEAGISTDMDSPFAPSEVWRTIALKGSIADAVRKGYDTLIMQSGEANAGRGGWSESHSEWTREPYIDWSFQTTEVAGVETEVFIIKTADGGKYILQRESLGGFLGYDVSKELQARARGDSPPVNELENFPIIPIGAGGYIVMNRETQDMTTVKSAADAQAMVKRLAQVEIEKSAGPRGRITELDMGGTINLAYPQRVKSHYQEEWESRKTGKAIGAREAYDKITINAWKKYLKNFGATITETTKRIPEDQYEIVQTKDGQRLNYTISKEFQDSYPNLRTAALGDDTGYVIVSDNGLHSNRVFRSEGRAKNAIHQLYIDARTEIKGIKVYEIKINEEMKQYFGGGKIPILSVGGTYPWEVSSQGEGDLYIQRVGPNAGTVHKTRQGPSDFAISFDQTQLLPDYAYYLLQFLQPKLNARKGGTAQQFIKISDINEVLTAHFTGDTGLPIMSMGSDHPNPDALRSAMDKIGQVPINPTMGQRWDDLKKRWRGELDQGVFDKFHGIKRALKLVDWTGPAEQNPYIMARLSTSLESQMKAVMEYGHPVWKDGIMQTEGEGLLDILAPVGNPDTLRKWSAYMVGKRAKRLKEEGREQLFNDEEIQAMIDVGEESQIFEEVAQKYAAFNKKVLDFAEQAGMIDPESRALWEHADYIPFYRVADERIVGPLAARNGIADQRNPIKRLKGGEQAISDIPTNMIQNITTLIDGANKNQAALLAADALVGTGLMHKVSNAQLTTALVPMGQVKAKLIEAGMNPEHIPPDALKGLQKMFAIEPTSGPDVITMMREGKRETYRVDDSLLFEALTQINAKRFGRWMNFFRGPKRFMTQAITLDPGFMARNYLRDLGSSYVLSRDVNNPAKHIARSVQGWKQALAGDESLQIMMSAGAAFEVGYMNQGDPDAASKAIRRVARKKGFGKDFIGTVLDTPMKLFDAYRALGTSVENSNRIAVFNEAIANGKSKAQAAFESKDLMDFSMGGSWAPVQFLIQSVPFMGARLQGMHRMGRGFAEHPTSFALKGLMISMAGMALWLKFADDDRYEELEEWDKQAYFHWWINDEHYRLPKPFEIGAIFNTIPEMMVQYYIDAQLGGVTGKEANRVLLKGFGHMISQTFSMNPVPQTFAPAVESFFNYNFFTGRSIASPYEEERLPPEQFRASTSPTVVELARSLPPGLDKISPKLRSPLHLQSLYDGYTATLGRYAMLGADALVANFMDYPPRPSMRPGDYPVLGSFYRGGKGDVRRTKYEEGFYDQIRQTLKIQGSLRFLEKVEMLDRAEMIEARDAVFIDNAQDLNKARQEISKLNKEIMEIHFSPEMTPEEKRARIDEIQSDKNFQYKEIYDNRPSRASVTEEDMTYLIEQFGADEAITKIQEQHPATAALMKTIGDSLSPEQVAALTRVSQ